MKRLRQIRRGASLALARRLALRSPENVEKITVDRFVGKIDRAGAERKTAIFLDAPRRRVDRVAQHLSRKPTRIKTRVIPPILLVRRIRNRR